MKQATLSETRGSRPIINSATLHFIDYTASFWRGMNQGPGWVNVKPIFVMTEEALIRRHSSLITNIFVQFYYIVCCCSGHVERNGWRRRKLPSLRYVELEFLICWTAARHFHSFLSSSMCRCIGAQRSPYWTRTYASYDVTPSNQFCMVIKLDERKTFTRSTMVSAVAKNVCDTDADAWSVCGC